MAGYFIFATLFLFCSCTLVPVVKAKDVVAVAVYYESLCPDSKRFILQQLQPNYDKIANDIRLDLIPYGNCKTDGKKDEYTFSCQHQEEECRGNTIQICALRILNDTKQGLNFVTCAFQQNSQYEIIKKCIKSPTVQKKIQQCADGPMGNNLSYKMGVLTDALVPAHTFIPWITFNNKGSGEINFKAMDNFVEMLCQFYKSDIPVFCHNQKRKMTDFYHRLGGL